MIVYNSTELVRILNAQDHESYSDASSGHVFCATGPAVLRKLGFKCSQIGSNADIAARGMADQRACLIAHDRGYLSLVWSYEAPASEPTSGS